MYLLRRALAWGVGQIRHRKMEAAVLHVPEAQITDGGMRLGRLERKPVRMI